MWPIHARNLLKLLVVGSPLFSLALLSIRAVVSWNQLWPHSGSCLASPLVYTSLSWVMSPACKDSWNIIRWTWSNVSSSLYIPWVPGACASWNWHHTAGTDRIAHRDRTEQHSGSETRLCGSNLTPPIPNWVNFAVFSTVRLWFIFWQGVTREPAQQDF